MMDLIKKNKLLLIALFTCFFFLNKTLDVELAEAEGLNFNVEVVQPENQIDKKQTYFDLMVQPGMEQELQINITNLADRDILVDVIPNIATTNQNGEVSFSETPKEMDKTLKKPITELLSGKQRVALGPNEKRQIKFKLTVPDERFFGKIAGGFLFKEIVAEEKEDPDSGVVLTNQFVLVKGIQLREDEKPVKEQLVIHDAIIDAVNARRAVLINLQNVQPDFVKEGSITIKIIKKGNTDILFKETKNNLNMAPNSNVDLPFYIQDLLTEAGTYEVMVDVKTSQFKKTETKEVKIAEKDVIRISEETIATESRVPFYLKFFSMILPIVLLTMSIIFGSFKLRKKLKR